MLAPVALQGTLRAMVAEVVLTPLLITERTTPGENLRFALSLLGRTLPVALVGPAGYAGSMARGRRGREWPLPVVLAWFTAVVVLFDLDFYPDLFPWFAVIGIGVVNRGRGLFRHPAAPPLPVPRGTSSVDTVPF